ncbi:MAG: hypothetical protein GY810_09255 [Aureispira sp.]|nr:hypothetical protein [Aureispira sp.]
MRLICLLIVINWQPIHAQMLELPIYYILENHIKEVRIDYLDLDSEVDNYLVYQKTTKYNKAGLALNTKELYHSTIDTIYTSYTYSIDSINNRRASKEVRTRWTNNDTISKQLIFYKNYSITALNKDTLLQYFLTKNKATWDTIKTKKYAYKRGKLSTIKIEQPEKKLLKVLCKDSIIENRFHTWQTYTQKTNNKIDTLFSWVSLRDDMDISRIELEVKIMNNDLFQKYILYTPNELPDQARCVGPDSTLLDQNMSIWKINNRTKRSVWDSRQRMYYYYKRYRD